MILVLLIGLLGFKTSFAGENDSVVDFMKSRGADSSYSNRKKIFQTTFGADYSGSVTQNLQLHKYLREQEAGFCRVDLRANIMKIGGISLCPPSKFGPLIVRLSTPAESLSGGNDGCAFHTYLLTTDQEGRRHYFRAGPTNRNPLDWGPIQVIHGEYVPGTVDYQDPVDREVHVGIIDDPDCEATLSNLREHAQRINNEAIGYQLLGPNCHTYGREAVIDATGLRPAELNYSAPGFHQTLHGPH